MTLYLIIIGFVSVGITMWLRLFLPTLSLAKSVGTDNTFTQNPKLAGFTLLVMMIIGSPLLLPSMIIPSKFSNAKKELEAIICIDDEFLDLPE